MISFLIFIYYLILISSFFAYFQYWEPNLVSLRISTLALS